MAEHGVPQDKQVSGIILDGFGLGLDGAGWGGEVLEGTYRVMRRVAHLRYVPLPGGDRAAVEPYRMATSYLLDAGFDETDHPSFDPEIAAVCQIGKVSPPTSSAGRLFDGVSALLGIAPRLMDYEGEAAARLEALANTAISDGYSLPLVGDELDIRELIRGFMADDSASANKAARFINGLADGLVEAVMGLSSDTVVLGGGCFVNRLLLGRLVFRLRGCGKRVFYPQRLPSGDGGLSAGQAACAACVD
jgi:hydrogenase maturation protein HypF